MTTRQEILLAIKQTSVRGRALGEGAFSSATGIKQHEWWKHWVRWNQAIVEAGFSPNTLTPKYADEVLGTRLAELARSLGSVPVKGDIDHKKAAEPTSPEAQGELISAAQFYERENEGLGLDFVATVQHAYERLPEFPASGAPVGPSASASPRSKVPLRSPVSRRA